MTSEEAGYLGAMTYNNLYAPVLDTLRQQNRTDDRALAAVHKLKMKLAECERQSPSFLFDLTKQLINQSELNVNLQEAYLRMHDSAPYDDLVVVGYENVPEYKELTESFTQYPFVNRSELPVEKRKREFVHYSKRFSNTLKTYFKDQNAAQVNISANQLVFQTVMVVRTVNEKLRRN
ncbi:hypothetical protein WR25_24590 [Diploscapter pachys]|uniref:Programmed cell death protein 10 dimerisation domain-containing protein n=1 Tax=Diploscapter pachys TaxID=2018661 RepID=A0A2A2JCC7_9BILA|nr:hypothetical protein WR25_24590 [Diploscapter pachys]